MRSASSTVSTFCDRSLLARDFFRAEGFCGETFLFLDVSSSIGGSFGGVTSPFSCLSYSPSSSWFTSSPPPPPSESDAVSSDALFMSYTSSFFLFFLVLLGPSHSIWVTKGLLMMSGLKSSVYLTGTRNSFGHSLDISFMSSSINL
jgi:hypothetical protein